MTSPTALRPLPRQRRHTVHFLGSLAGRAPVHLDAEADVTAVLGRRETDPGAPSITAYVVQAVATTLFLHPEANSAYHAVPFPLLARNEGVDVKVAFDVEIAGVRTVQSGLLRDAVGLTAYQVHEWITDSARALRGGRSGRAALLGLLPTAVGRRVFRAAVGPLTRRRALGTVSVTSLAHRPVSRIHSDGGTTVTVGIGRPTARPVIRSGEVEIREILPLSLTFDHRALDGALAADVLATLVSVLERTTP